MIPSDPITPAMLKALGFEKVTPISMAYGFRTEEFILILTFRDDRFCLNGQTVSTLGDVIYGIYKAGQEDGKAEIRGDIRKILQLPLL